jgi:hypothetical protein
VTAPEGEMFAGVCAGGPFDGQPVASPAPVFEAAGWTYTFDGAGVFTGVGPPSVAEPAGPPAEPLNLPPPA